MHYQLFSIGPLSFHSYGLMIGLGFIAALLLATYRAGKVGLDKDQVWNIWIICLVGGLLGAKLLYFIVEFKSITRMTFQDVMEGFVVYGGIIGAAVAIAVYCRIKKLELLKYFDLIVPSVALGQAFGRVGCLLAGCCYGRETDSSFHIVFKNTPFAPNNVQLIPTQALSAVGNLVIMLILLYIASRKLKDGLVICSYFILYGVGRFVIEMFRNDPRGTVGTFSTSQFISIFIVLLGVGLALVIKKRQVTAEAEDAE